MLLLALNEEQRDFFTFYIYKGWRRECEACEKAKDIKDMCSECTDSCKQCCIFGGELCAKCSGHLEGNPDSDSNLCCDCAPDPEEMDAHDESDQRSEGNADLEDGEPAQKRQKSPENE